MRINNYPVERDFKSLHHFLLNAAHHIHNPDKTYFWQKIDGKYTPTSYKTTLSNIDAIAVWFLSKGLVHGDKVAICLENSPEYVFIDQALIKIGCANASIYPTLTPEETAYILNDSHSKMIVVGNPFLYKKFQKISQNCSLVKDIILGYEYHGNDEMAISLAQIIEEGTQLLPQFIDTLQERFMAVGPQDLATLIYTSGTTGVPKGVMLSHWNFGSNCFDALELCPAINKDDRFLSFLPLCHVYERMATYYLGTYIGGEVAFAESLEKVSQNVAEIQPTILACVPRLLEKIEERVRKNATSGSAISAKIFNWSLIVGERYRKTKDAQKSIPFMLNLQYVIAHKLVYTKIHQRLGGKMRLFVSGGGALPVHVAEFFGNVGMRVQEGYGLTETSPFVTVNEFHNQVYGTAGRVAPRQEVALQNTVTLQIITTQTYKSYQPNFESEEGEILVKGPNIMGGYYNKPEETNAVFDAEGWFHTGDIGKFEKGYLKITDRIKNMFKTSLGKNVFPTPVENNYLKSDRIEQIFLIGDKREYITAIIVPNQETLKRELGLKDDFFASDDLMITDQAIKDWVSVDIKKLSNNLAKYERIKDFALKRNPFSIENNEITITLKAKRKVVEEKYATYIEAMYL